MEKPRVAIFDFAGCEGCQLQIINLEEEILDLLQLVDVVEWREGMSHQSSSYDIAIVEGSITRPEDAERLRSIRRQAKWLIALGSCATHGGVNKLRHLLDFDIAAEQVYGEAASQTHLQSEHVRAINEVVDVDSYVFGCPIDAREFAKVVKAIVFGKRPEIPEYPVCVECKLQGIICRYEYGEVCVGPLTRAGCDARCPSAGFRCFGCRGLLEDANVEAAREVMDRYGKTTDELEARMALFNTL